MRKRIYIVENDPIYRTHWAIHVGNKRSEALKWYGKKIGLPATAEELKEADEKHSVASIFNAPGYLAFILWFRNVPDEPDANILGTIAHEALHATFHVLHTVGVANITNDSEEAFTYYHAYLVREITARLWPDLKSNN